MTIRRAFKTCFGFDSDALDDAPLSEKHEPLTSECSSSERFIAISKRISTSERLAALRRLMSDQKLAAYVVVSEDEHGTEYVAPSERRRGYICGFNGSAGVAIVLRDCAQIFVDGRYYIQAAEQIDHNWTLRKVGQPGVPTWVEYIATHLRGERVGLDAKLISISLGKQLEKLACILVFPKTNLIDEIWSSKPARPSRPIEDYPVEFAGKSTVRKLAELRASLADTQTRGIVVSDLTEIAWLLNLRGEDVPETPVFFAYVIVDAQTATLYTDAPTIDRAAQIALGNASVTIANYTAFYPALADCSAGFAVGQDASFAIATSLKEARVLTVSPVGLAKSIKNPLEIMRIKDGYVRDAVQWCIWAAWLEELLVKKKQTISEWDAAEELTRLRKQDRHYRGLAYENISATAGNAAMPHYAPTARQSSLIDISTPYLNDSGPQYGDGCTIDTTRTMHYGKPTYLQKIAYTRVLQGHIAAATGMFPEGTTGATLDAYARRPLFNIGLNYSHGTGHGIGSYLCVHEGPLSIRQGNAIPLQEGMAFSIEPGYYEANEFGIRIESIYTPNPVMRTDSTKWFTLHRITQIPIDLVMVNWDEMSELEIRWLRAHNRECADTVREHLDPNDKRTLRWLERQCKIK
ncbi:uncharacterized protein L969DRAFT_86084 [Mixia osmundae IAM 14324]|uniref:Xaa-Pro aminopeptidase P n=1 Tax=Mixia osmundae (strain CBS 9802 / IAM 14324 / JCM 22182 / KY 12970) TaxID=764103 RepID=G7E591_MIXOS|nr:uncharacterized protein L969DRAFT_86084 [Mixia osmundae IAM 14324]KEI40849.1 hypothetical protein L969DRAFT_86084 [Mixia osmundae IAM 14324]GAA98001.1 hypothetical protein E5Q_04681 [Mixia osmundae IAM 14324]